ncbi:MAG: hypothetical protein LBS25_07200 [Candidatus Symbiothrix sp.]|jgi:hypothetical protein|nr:hypothetical protein [Candidatus Symbiothrix sp.]
MKSSSYIVIAFFVLLLGSCLVFNLCALNHQTSMVEHSVELEKFHTIVIQANAQINIQTGIENQLIVSLPKDSLVRNDWYTVHNDTLFWNYSPPEINSMSFRISGSGISAIVVKQIKRQINLESISGDNLRIEADEAFIRSENMQMNRLDIQSIQSHIYIRSKRIDTLSVCLRQNSYLSSEEKAACILMIDKDADSKFHSW